MVMREMSDRTKLGKESTKWKACALYKCQHHKSQIKRLRNCSNQDIYPLETRALGFLRRGRGASKGRQPAACEHLVTKWYCNTVKLHGFATYILLRKVNLLSDLFICLVL